MTDRDHVTAPSTSTSAPPPLAASSPGDLPSAEDLTLVAILNVLLRKRGLLIACAILFPAVVVGFALLGHRSYTSASAFMPGSRRNSSNLSGIAAQFGLAIPGGDPSQSSLFYADLVKTHQILGSVEAGRYAKDGSPNAPTARLAELLEIHAGNYAIERELVIARLNKIVQTDVALKTGIISMKVTTKYPALSYQLNRRLLELLNAFNVEARRSQATDERKFTEQRMQEMAVELRQAEDRLQTFLQNNRDYHKSPDLTFQQDRLARDVGMRQMLYTSLAQALEQAKIEEVRDTPVITIIVAPEPPVIPDGRGLTKLGILSILAGVVFGSVVAIGRASLQRGVAVRDPQWLELAAQTRVVASQLLHPIKTIRGTGRDRKPLGSGKP